MMNFAGIDFRKLEISDLSDSQLIIIQGAFIKNFAQSGLATRNFAMPEKIIKHLKNYMFLSSTDFLTLEQKMALTIYYLPECDLKEDDGIDNRIAAMRRALTKYNYPTLSRAQLEKVVHQEKTALHFPNKDWQYSVDASHWAIRRRHYTEAWSGLFEIGYMTENMLRDRILDVKRDDVKMWYSLEAVYLIELYLYIGKHKDFYLDNPEIYQFYLRCYGQICRSLGQIKEQLGAHDLSARAHKLGNLLFTECCLPPLLYRPIYRPERLVRKADSCSF